MQIVVLLLLASLTLNVFAFDHSYNVSGEDENGKSIEGTIYSNNGERNVSGEVTDKNGNTLDFEGQWDGYGRISGETDEGVSVQLNTN